MTGLSTGYERDCKIDIGSYVEAGTDATVTNDNTERTRSCVALGPVGNKQGSVNVLTSSQERFCIGASFVGSAKPTVDYWLSGFNKRSDVTPETRPIT